MTDVPEADAIEQAETVEQVTAPDEPHLGADVPEADALEQAEPVPETEDDERR